MPYAVTEAMVVDGFATSASSQDITATILIVDQADTCLTANSVADAIGVHLKILAVRHLLTKSSDKGAVTSERAISGAARTYASQPGGETGYYETLRAVDATGCVLGVLNNSPRIQLRSIGRRAP